MEGKERSFKSWRPSDKGDTIWWALVFIWAALILLAENTNYASNFAWWNGWSIFFTGIGIFALIGFIMRMVIPKVPSPSFWDLLFILIMLGIGQGGHSVWFLPLVLGIIGIAILLSAFRRGE